MAPSSLTDLPSEILDTVLHHYYPPWTIYIHDRPSHTPLALSGLPSPTLLRVSRYIASQAQRHERRSFTRQLVFTTSSTQWRLLNRLRNISPTRLAWVIDNIQVLVFCSPPLFTNRIPWTSLSGLRRIELDYCYRSANFRCRGSARELETGCLDPLIVGFARDTERFDGPLVEDAWRAHGDGAAVARDSDVGGGGASVDLDFGERASSSADTDASVGARRVEVIVIKRMNVFESAAACAEVPSDRACTVKPESWNLKVTATHRGRIEDIRFQIIQGSHETPFGETIVWTAEKGFRDIVPLEEATERELKVKENCEREKYLCDVT